MTTQPVATKPTVIARPASLTRLLVFLLPATTAMFALYNGVQQILLPAQIEQLDPVHKVGNLAMLTTFGAIATMLAIPLGGTLSDRTRSRFGRRTPWLVVLSALSGVLMIAMGFASNLVLLAVTFSALWLVSNMFQGALIPILPDRVPVERRGFGSAIIGLGGPLGVLFGVNVAGQAGQVWGYTVIGVVVFASTLLLVLGAREGASPERPAAPPRAKVGRAAAVRDFLEAFADRDFRMAFISRFALFLSYFTVSGYLYYTLSDYIGVEQIPGGDVPAAVGTLLSITVLTWLVVATFCGWLADRLDRRKLFVGISAVGLGLTMFIPIISPTWTGMLVYSVFGGAFIGTYFAVDLAVMSMVLPHKEQEGRDFGLLTVATGLPTILSSVIAGGLITFAGGYPALYLFGTVAAVVAGITIFGVKKVR